MAAATQSVLEDQMAVDAIKSLPLPKGVRLAEAFFDTDHAGDNALRVTFAVSKKLPLTAARLRTLAALDEQVADAVRPFGFGALSYVRFRDAV